MKKQVLAILFFIGLINLSYATHNRAGEITVERENDSTLLYKVTVVTYTYTKAEVDRDSLALNWGDNTFSIINRKSIEILPNDYQKNTYVARHLYSGPGIYQLVMQDPNRNEGVNNIPNSVYTVFSLSTTILIDNETGSVNSPILLNPPFDRAALNHPFIHNPAAYDPDGDSLSYYITKCRQENGEVIPGYVYPEASDTLFVDPLTGDLVWDAPLSVGKYNIAMEIKEWRKNVIISNIIRDMQIDVIESTNNPPVNQDLQDYCLLAGDTLEFEVISTDPDNDRVFHRFSGGPGIANNVSIYNNVKIDIDTLDADYGIVRSRFTWYTNYSNVRKQPYQLVVKAEDNNAEVNLIDSDISYIKITAPAIELSNITSKVDTIELRWDAPEYSNHLGFYIYRKKEPSQINIDTCIQGIPDEAEFERIEAVSNTSLSFTDINNLQPGNQYCYRVTAYFADGAESLVSNELCSNVKPGNPAILETSVITSDVISGKIKLSWAMPLDYISSVNIADFAPYKYKIERSTDNISYNELASIISVDLSDTVFIDTLINTVDVFPYYYTVKMLDKDDNLIGKPEISSTQYSDLILGDNTITHLFQKNSHTFNRSRDLYRKLENEVNFNFISNIETDTYTDTKLINNLLYTYQFDAIEYRNLYGKNYNIINTSHIISGTPIDTFPPCQPIITDVSSDCDEFINSVIWEIPGDTCIEDVLYYNLYYTPYYQGELILIESEIIKNQQLYYHRIDTELTSIAGCYAISAVDSFANESDLSEIVCIDECSGYELPNIFAPGTDGVMDIYIADNPFNFVKEVEMQIFSRWGTLVYETTDPDINWNGINTFTNKMVSGGVYYYVCVVYEPRLSGIAARTLKGFIHVYPDNDNVAE